MPDGLVWVWRHVTSGGTSKLYRLGSVHENDAARGGSGLTTYDIEIVPETIPASEDPLGC